VTDEINHVPEHNFMNLMRTNFMAIATTIISLVSVPSLTLAQEVPTTLQQQMPYADARQILIESGWQAIQISPMRREQRFSTVNRLNQKLRCKQTEYGTAFFLSDTYAPRGGESTLEEN